MDPRQALYARLRARLRDDTAQDAAQSLGPVAQPAQAAPPPPNSQMVNDYMAGKYDLKVSPEDLAALEQSQESVRGTKLIAGLGRAGQMFSQAWGANNADPAFFDKMAQTAEGRRELVGKYLQAKQAKGADLMKERAQFVADRENKLTDDETQRAFDTEQRRLDRISRERAAALSAGTAAAARTDKSVTDLSKSLEDAAGLKEDVATLVAAARQPDVPSVGPIDKWKPTFMQGEDEIRTEQAAGRFLAALLKIQSGVSVNPQELARAMKARGLSGGNEQAFRIGVEAMLREMEVAMKQKEAGYPGDVAEELRRRGGVTSKDLPKYQATDPEQAPAGGLDPAQKARLEELRRKRDAGALK